MLNSITPFFVERRVIALIEKFSAFAPVVAGDSELIRNLPLPLLRILCLWRLLHAIDACRGANFIGNK